MSQQRSGGASNQWQFGVFMAAVVVVSGIAGGAALWSLDVPFGRYIGGAIGAVLGFLAISYWYYGR